MPGNLAAIKGSLNGQAKHRRIRLLSVPVQESLTSCDCPKVQLRVRQITARPEISIRVRIRVQAAGAYFFYARYTSLPLSRG
jgi:hypothetical protein